jgi:uncharacterized protein YndB with AHSA1/START domain
MARSDPAPSSEIVIEREFDAPPALVFREWLNEESIRDWFAPETYVTTACRVDAKPGGSYHIEYRSNDGHVFNEHGVFREVEAPKRLVLTLTHVHDGQSGPETSITVTFEDSARGTRMCFRQTGFDSVEYRDANAEGWQGCFAKLQRRLHRAATATA